MPEWALSFMCSMLSATYRYVGCFIDVDATLIDRDLTVYKEDWHDIESCSQDCQGYRYFSLQSSKQCFCGNTAGRYGKASETDCNYPCVHDNAYTCGGHLRNSVYMYVNAKGKLRYVLWKFLFFRIFSHSLRAWETQIWFSFSSLSDFVTVFLSVCLSYKNVLCPSCWPWVPFLVMQCYRLVLFQIW